MSVEELRKLKFSALERMAHERGIAASVIDEAIDADSPKAALVALLAPASSPATEPEPDGDDVECNDDEDAWWLQPAFAQGGTDYCDVRLLPARRPACCICGRAGHSREECSEPAPQMPGFGDDYCKVGGHSRRKSSGSKKTEKTKRRRERKRERQQNSAAEFRKRPKVVARSFSAAQVEARRVAKQARRERRKAERAAKKAAKRVPRLTWAYQYQGPR